MRVGGGVVAPVAVGLHAALARYVFENQWHAGTQISWVELLIDFCLTSGAGMLLPVDHSQRPPPTVKQLMHAFRGAITGFVRDHCREGQVQPLIKGKLASRLAPLGFSSPVTCISIGPEMLEQRRLGVA
eukprot:387788-Alexandrium_andersonii.AAC.1